MTIALLADVVGMIGTVLIVGSYFLLQLEKVTAKSVSYNLLNLIGAGLLLFSLTIHFNLASVVIEIFWLLASMIGLYKSWRRRNV